MTAIPTEEETLAHIAELVSLHRNMPARTALFHDWLVGLNDRDAAQWSGFMLARMLGYFDDLVDMWPAEAKEQALQHWADIATVKNLTRDLDFDGLDGSNAS